MKLGNSVLGAPPHLWVGDLRSHMSKVKSTTRVSVSNGRGGLVPLEDHRFGTENWDIEFKVDSKDADEWLLQMEGECSDRKWTRSGLGQFHKILNSESVTIGNDDGSRLVIVWERTPNGPLIVKARASDSWTSSDILRRFLDHVTDRCARRQRSPFYRRGVLQYEGLPWRGELWLNEGLRLGPPSARAPCVLGPHAIVVDMFLQAVDGHHANVLMSEKLREVAVFLGVVLRSLFSAPVVAHSWTQSYDTGGKLRLEVRQLGYVETAVSGEMPPCRTVHSVPTKTVVRPDMSRPGLNVSEEQLSIPADTAQLWDAYARLAAQQRDQFLGAAYAWQVARKLARDHETSSIAFMVVACESLKPFGKRYNQKDMYDVVEALLGKETCQELRRHDPPPVRIRGDHLHRASLHGGETKLAHLMTTFFDPSLQELASTLCILTPAAIIEWLRRGGVREM